MARPLTILIAYEGCIYREVADAVVRAARVSDLVVATPDGRDARVGEGWRLGADLSFADVRSEGIKRVLIPGGDIYVVKDDVALDQLLLSAAREGASIGGICNGALLVAKSGLLRGRRLTHVAIPKYSEAPEFAELLEYAAPHR